MRIGENRGKGVGKQWHRYMMVIIGGGGGVTGRLGSVLLSLTRSNLKSNPRKKHSTTSTSLPPLVLSPHLHPLLLYYACMLPSFLPACPILSKTNLTGSYQHLQTNNPILFSSPLTHLIYLLLLNLSVSLPIPTSWMRLLLTLPVCH